MTRLSFNLILSYAFIFLIFILSFRSFAGFLAPNFDADQAVHVLMAFDLNLPEDLYYWGQSRLGSLLPILGHGLLSISWLTPLEAVSYVQYFFLIIGFFCFISLFKRIISKVVFALVWFLPPEPFVKLVELAHPYAPQLALLGIALVFTNKLASISNTQSTKKTLFSLVITSSLILSIWVSDLSVIPAILAAILFFCPFLKQYWRLRTLPKQYLKNLLLSRFNRAYLWVVIASLFWFSFLAYAKFHASKQDVDTGLLAVNSIDIVATMFGSIVTTIWSAILFQVNNPFLSLYVIACLAAIFVLYQCFMQVQQDNTFTSYSRWIPFLLISAAGTFFLILMSRWTYLHLTPSRYFIGVYLASWLSALLMFETLDPKWIHKIIIRRVSILLVLTALLGSLSLPNYVFAIEKVPSRFSLLQPIASLGRVGFIGDYWASYLMCIVAPQRLSCTPHEQDLVRCARCVKNVFESRVIYVVKRDWLNSFPEEIQQFGQRLEKQGRARIIAGYWMAPYRAITRPF